MASMRPFAVAFLFFSVAFFQTGCDLVFTNSVTEESDTLQVTYDPDLEGEWTFDSEESDRRWRDHSWTVEQHSDTEYKLTKYSEGNEVPYAFRGQLIEAGDRQLFQLQGLTWPPGTAPGFNLYEFNRVNEDRIVLSTLDREAALDILNRDEFEQLNVYTRENYPLLVHSTGPIIDQLLKEFFNEELFSIRLVYSRVDD